MSEPDAVPLPREGEVFFDVRGEARSMRLSWYANSRVAVFSIWQGNRCTGTFRLPLADLDRMVRTLQAGPPMPASPASRAYDSYAPEYAAPASYQPYGDPYGPQYEQPRYEEPQYSEPQYSEPQYEQPQYQQPQYQQPQYQQPQYEQPQYSEPQYSEPQYSEPPRYATADRAGSHRRTSYSDDYGDLRSNRSETSLRETSAPLMLPEDPESLPETAMLSFPSVPARNGPGAY
jgi:hypothetical protein